MTINRIFALLLCSISFLCCSNGEDMSKPSRPIVAIKVNATAGSSVTLNIKIQHADYVRILCEATSNVNSQTAESVTANGTKYTESKIVIDKLQPQTKYTVFAVAGKDNETYGELQYVQFTTSEADPAMYSWEEKRNGILSFTDMVLCYGGSRHRSPYRWEKERFAPYVTYKDEQGKEQWLFDSFLCIEFQTLNKSYMTGQKLPSAGRAEWQDLIDYWFDKNNGVNALEATVKDASARIGTPTVKRKVIMTMPDPIIYEQFADMKSSTTYWGKLDGRTMDFNQSKDRVAVYKWYINEVRKKFNEANYQYVELAGFYIISEDLVVSSSNSDGWNHELKKSDEIIPPMAEYLKALNEALCWIPYNRAGGYRKASQLKIDYTYMQPNHFWDDKGERPMSRFFSDIKAYNLAMEFEFDEALLEGKPDCDVYKKRFREYMAGAKQEGIYGTKPLSYYHGTNGFYELWKSTNEKDKELYHEFCQFVINNPLRK